jgi:hypothetical protein
MVCIGSVLFTAAMSYESVLFLGNYISTTGELATVIIINGIVSTLSAVLLGYSLGFWFIKRGQKHVVEDVRIIRGISDNGRSTRNEETDIVNLRVLYRRIQIDDIVHLAVNEDEKSL